MKKITINQVETQLYCKPLVAMINNKKYIIGIHPPFTEYDKNLYEQVMKKWKEQRENWESNKNITNYTEHKVLSSKGDKEYIVTIYNDKSYTCTCKAFQFYKKCKHYEEIVR